ncbi:hypothetical protein CDL15_Pgr002941 [Punica granatum]|uniref:VQ domain-containing protein n=1 Tax=Punica granatum TaxID=22663 RepID=A0A218X290_PUNGR|nr:hypothetical protein CDL15_Pgr002941 [Punica granatum]PKI31354.1 hypothetical protein CRG98_048280 [Punica granatum]
MGKKLSYHQSSLKISKHENKKSFSRLISALRPKVYITESSSFKQLVQELTGNGSQTEPREELLTVEFSTRESDERRMIEAGLADSSEGCTWEQPNQEEAYQIPLNDQVPDRSADNPEQGADFAYRLLESWLLDTEHDQFCHGYDQLGYGLSVYDSKL